MNHNSARKMKAAWRGHLAPAVASLLLGLAPYIGSPWSRWKNDENAQLVCSCRARSPRLLPIAFWTKTHTLNTVCRAPGGLVSAHLPSCLSSPVPPIRPLRCHIPHALSFFQLLQQLVEPFRAFMNPYFKCTTLLRQTHFGEDWVRLNLTEQASERDAYFPHVMI